MITSFGLVYSVQSWNSLAYTKLRPGRGMIPESVTLRDRVNFGTGLGFMEITLTRLLCITFISGHDSGLKSSGYSVCQDSRVQDNLHTSRVTPRNKDTR